VTCNAAQKYTYKTSSIASLSGYLTCVHPCTSNNQCSLNCDPAV